MFLIPTITKNLQSGGSIQYAALVIATWCLYCDRGVDRRGQPLEIVDGMKDALRQAAQGTSQDKLSFLRLKPVFGKLAENERFAAAYSQMIDLVYENQNLVAHMRKLMASNPS